MSVKPAKVAAAVLALTANLAPVFVVWAEASAPASALLEVEPGLCHLGSISPEDPLTPFPDETGPVNVRLLAAEAWGLELTLAGPPRRLADGREPLGPIPHGPCPPPLRRILSLQPTVVMSGQGSDARQEFQFESASPMQTLGRCLPPATPAGTYQAVLLGRLVTDEGKPLTGQARILVQFDVMPWARLINETGAIEVSCDWSRPLEGLVESTPTLILISANSSWELRISGVGGVLARNNIYVSPQLKLSARVSAPATMGGEVEALGWVTIGSEPIPIARGGPAPYPGDCYWEIPLVVRLESDSPLTAGRYSTRLVLKVEATVPRP